MLCLLKNLFPKINDFQSFNNKNIKIEKQHLHDNYGHIIIKVYNDIYNWMFRNGHYDLVYKEKNKKINYVFFSDDDMMKFYEDMYNRDYEFLIKKYNEKIKNWYYYILNDDEDIIKFFNISSDFLSDKEYCKIYEYIINNCDDDKKRRTIYDVFKIKEKITKNQQILGYIEYYNDNETLLNIKKIKFKIKFQIKNLILLLKIIPCLTIIKNFANIDNTLFGHLDNLNFLSFNQYFNQSVDNLPQNLTHLSFGDKFNKPVDNLPQKITHLTFGDKFNQSVDNLPVNLTHLTFGDNFNQKVDNLPQKITHLTFGHIFNQSVDNLPKTLTYLTFGYDFNQSVDNLPKTLTYLTFKDVFNKPVNNLPENLTLLTFSHNFNQLVDNLPKTLTYLTFGYHFNQSVDNLPKTLTYLTFGNNFNKSVDNLPINLTHLTFKYYFNQPVNNLPNNLTHLTFGGLFNQSVDNLPKTLTHLTFGTTFNQSVDNLPNNITHLTFLGKFNQHVDNLPKTLTHLTFSDEFNQSVDKLPLSLTHLIFGDKFNKQVNLLPESLTHLTLDKCFDHLVNFLPENLTHLIINYSYNQYIDKLPNNLTHLTFGDKLLSKNLLNNFPVKLSHIKLFIDSSMWQAPIYLENLNKVLPKTTTHLILSKRRLSTPINFPINNLPETLIYLKICDNYLEELTLPKNLKELVIYYGNRILDNLPNHIEKLFILFDNSHIFALIDKLPSTLKEIVIENIKFKKYIKIPKGTIITIKKNGNYNDFEDFEETK
jgi:hypothetical protein